ncbi:MAG TPA: lipopolysaccharide biosynthesis protein [Thermogutta sp.]|nr:lipopolysaccharide biosynthesis protein [Thermogutta sp.]
MFFKPTHREKAECRQDEEAALGLRSTTLPPLRLSLNFCWTFFGNITQALSRLLLLVVIVKWEGLETVGLWVLTTSLCSSVFTCCELGLRPLLICDVRRVHPFQDYYSLRLVLALAGAVAVVAFGGFSYGPGTALGLLAIVAVGRTFDSLSDICYGLLQREERMDRIGAGMALRYAGGMVGMLAALMLGYGLVIAALVDSLVAALVYWFWSRRNAKTLLAGFRRPANPAVAFIVEDLRWSPPRRVWLSLLWLSIPLGIVAIEINLATNLPRYLVDSILGRESLAIFATLLQFAAAGMIFVQALGNALAPRLTRYYQSNDARRFWGLLARFLGMTTLLGMLPLVLLWTESGRNILAWIFCPQLLEDPAAARWLALSVCLLYVTGPLGRGVTSVLRFHSHVVIRGVTLGLMLALIPPLATTYGLSGAGMGLTLALLLTLPLYGWVIVKAWKIGGHSIALPQRDQRTTHRAAA